MAGRGIRTLWQSLRNPLSPSSLCRRGVATKMYPSRVRYKFMEDVERVDFYVPGGYHPVLLGDEFCSGRYKVAHKLGSGGSATIWMAHDTLQDRLVALKISTAESVNRNQEIDILSQLAETKSSLPGKNMMQSLHDSFTISGPNGAHKCLVTDVARLNLHELKDYHYHRLLRLPVARAIAAQLVLAVQFLHSQGIVHGGMSLPSYIS